MAEQARPEQNASPEERWQALQQQERTGEAPRYSWTQPQCATCWHETHPGRQPVKLTEAELEKCVTCGAVTDDVVYIRIDPAKALYPTRPKD